jgi:hypothetical protein
MLHTVYKTTNLLNGNYYFGYHKTRHPNDSYLGSGLYIQRAIRKYGVGNFQKEVLFIYLDSASAFGKEAELVEVFRHDPRCQNIRQGGAGGFDYINRNGLVPKMRSGSANPHFGKKQTLKNKAAVTASNQRRRKHPPKQRLHVGVAEANRLRIWSDASRRKLGAKQSSLKWICCGGAAQRVQPSEVANWIQQGWKLGRK